MQSHPLQKAGPVQGISLPSSMTSMFIPMFTYDSSELPRPPSPLAGAQFLSTQPPPPSTSEHVQKCSSALQSTKCPLEFLLWILLQGGVTEGGKCYPKFVRVELKK